jgi:4-coumarate--CoA ligase
MISANNLIYLFNLLFPGYGLTETSPTTHILPIEDSVRKVGTVGLLLPNLEARLVLDDTDGKANEDAKPGEAGELWIRGPSVMKVRYPIRSFVNA